MVDVNRRELRLIGMSRSGNHALIHWITSQLRGSYCFLNCCEPKSNPFESARVMEDGRRVATNIASFDLAREGAGSLSAKDWLLFSHEDNFLGNACSSVFEAEHDRWVGASGQRLDLLLLRDPFNLFASRLARASASVSVSVAARIWKQHARQFVRGPRALRAEPVLILYDRWVREAGYRRALAARLGIGFTDAGIDDVPACGGGSSFDGRAYHGDARAMRVFDRWQHAIASPEYRAAFDAEMIELATAIFGPHPAARALGWAAGAGPGAAQPKSQRNPKRRLNPGPGRSTGAQLSWVCTPSQPRSITRKPKPPSP
jgi:hypothetical protein